MKLTTSAELASLLNGTGEFAILDPREEGDYSLSPHLFHSVNLPLSRLELRVQQLLPVPAVPIVVAGDGGELDRRAAIRLCELGYIDVRLLAGGVESWEAHGYPLFTGFNTLSKAFGEFVETHCGTPSISPDQLQAWIQSGRPLVILDSRTPEEHLRGTIPGSVSTPGAELVLRAGELAPSAETTVIVNCAGRTRSIIGAQSLLNAGISNPVYALRNGTMGWALAGLPIEAGSTRRSPMPGVAALARAQAQAAAVRSRYGIRSVDWNWVRERMSSRCGKTTYLFDVRHRSEHETGHPSGAVCAPGGQLIQATDTYIAVRGSTVVLYDPLDVRAVMTASWLRQMGHHDVRTLAPESVPAQALVTGSEESPVARRRPATPAFVEAQALVRNLEGHEVVDLRSSRDYEAAHIPGAVWSTRALLAETLAALSPRRPVVLVSDCQVLAELAVDDLDGPASFDLSVLTGGMRQWEKLGFPTRAGHERRICFAKDAFVKPFEAQDREASMRNYLDWEVGLTEMIARHPAIRFSLEPA